MKLLRSLNECRHAIRERDKACELARIIGREAKGGGEPSRLARMGRHDRIEPGLEALSDEIAALLRGKEGKSTPVYHKRRTGRFEHSEGELFTRPARRVETRA